MAATFGCLGISYFCIMACGGFGLRLPKEGWAPPAAAADGASSAGPAVAAAAPAEAAEVHVDVVHRTPQFWLLWAATAGNAVGGTIILSSAKLMMAETFGTTNPGLVGPAFCAAYVSALSVANMSGRMGWAALSDVTGRQR